eukprot:3565440-Rhodomonas_salina.1
MTGSCSQTACATTRYDEVVEVVDTGACCGVVGRCNPHSTRVRLLYVPGYPGTRGTRVPVEPMEVDALQVDLRSGGKPPSPDKFTEFGWIHGNTVHHFSYPGTTFVNTLSL